MTDPGKTYLSLKLAPRLFDKPLEALDPPQRRKLEKVAARQQEIESLILNTAEAAHVMVPSATIHSSLQEIRDRYAGADDFHAELARIGLDEDDLRQAVERDLVVESVLDKVASRAASVSATDIEIFWFMHRDRFRHAETRTLRHILLTINEALAGSERPQAMAKMASIAQRIARDPGRFGEQALKHSECPTAMNGGLLGNVPRGQLYPELESAAFALPTGGISAIVESELGFHLILCEAIQPERNSTLDEARATICDHLAQQRRSVCQKSWINSLRGGSVTKAV